MTRLTALLLLLTGTSPADPENVLRNGSFEGSLLYWHNIDPKHHTLVPEGKVGPTALRIGKGGVMSAPFVARAHEPATVSFWVKAEKPSEVRVQMPGSAREESHRAKRLWTGEATKSAKIGTDWQRVSFTWTCDIPQSGFWPDPHYMVLIETPGVPILVDGVTVLLGKEGTADYVPRRAVEVTAECPDLPGYAGAKANLLERDATARVTAHVSNPGPQPREVTVRWQLFDYEGERPVGPAIDRKLSVAAGATLHETVPLKLTATGTVLARTTVLGPDPIDSSDLPLTSLPYPKAATKPDWRERFGGSFAGGVGCVDKFQKIGFGWIRWRPHMNGEDHLPKDPRGEAWEWRWFDKELDEQESRGCSTHCVLYPPPKWIMEPGHPLPKDMRWAADDPRWDDLSLETTWDKFVKGAVEHYKGRSLVYEIENEPEFDKWDKFHPEYARFTIRTAKRIRQTDPKAKIMVDNVYGIPSPVNSAFFKAGGLKFIDIMSWHDYHAGWLADATSLKRMRQNMDEAGGKHVEIWFNEGWAFTNTAVDEPPACTGLTSAQSTNAIFDCVAELTANGQDKTILFHTAYEQHGMSFWDYSGPGTMLWDWYSYPMPLVAAWNVLSHHIGVSEAAGFVRPPGANVAVFQDLRNERGVMIAYADRGAKADVTVALPDFGAPLLVEDAMGNAATAPKTITLSKTGRPALLYSPARTAAKTFVEKLQPLDRKHAGFVSTSGSAPSWSLPPSWEGKEKGKPDGSVASADGKPVWKLEQLWPPDWKKKENFRPMIWTGTDWNVAEGGFGGQPGAAMKDNALVMGTRAPHGNPPAWRVCGLTFVAPKAGTYSLSGTVECRMWDSKNKTTLHLLARGEAGVREEGRIEIQNHGKASLEGRRVTLEAGEDLTLLPRIDGAFAGGDCALRDLRITLDGAAASANPVYRLPAAWEGRKKGSAEGNPAMAGGKAIWRIDRVYPTDVIKAENYAPVPWDGTSWHPEDHQQGGQPSVRVESGTATLSVSGYWANAEFQKIAGIAFIAPDSGSYRVRGTASTKPWGGDARTFKLAVLKKDTQRAAELRSFELPREGKPVPLEFEVELTSGHELVFLPLMPDWHSATSTTLEGLTIEKLR